jgi:hypothetical protein
MEMPPPRFNEPGQPHWVVRPFRAAYAERRTFVPELEKMLEILWLLISRSGDSTPVAC